MGKRIFLTKASVDAIEPSAPNKKRFVWDDRLIGFGAYRQANGVVVFVYQYRKAYCPAKRITIGRLGDVTPAQARGIAEEFAHQKRQGIDPINARREQARETEAAKSMVMARYVEEFLRRREIEKKPMTQQHARILIRDVAGLMPNVRIDKLTTTDIDKFLEDLALRSISARTYGLIYLKVLLNDAKRRGKIVASAADAYDVPPRVERTRVMTRSEIQRYLEACRDNGTTHGLVYECIMRTMKRKEEVAGMRWEEIDQSNWVWTIPASRMKTKVVHVMDLPAQVVAIIEKLHPEPNSRRGFVFTFNGSKSIKIATQDKYNMDAHIQRRIELAEAAGTPQATFDHWSPHDSRTTATTILADEPFNLRTDDLELCIAHSVSTSKYNRAQRRAAVGRAIKIWNRYLDEIMSRKDAWPGGRDIAPLGKYEIKPLWKKLRASWPERKYDDGRVKKARAKEYK